MCWRTNHPEEICPMVGLPRYRQFVGFFNEPVQALKRANIFTSIPRNRLILVASYDAHGDTEDLFSSLQGLLGGVKKRKQRVDIYGLI